jgi:hypothetical protein
MTKAQKIWLWVSLAMFVVPELIWAPTLGLFPVTNVLYDMDFRTELLSVLLLQIAGSILCLVCFTQFFRKKNPVFYWLVIIFLSFLILKSASIFFILFSFRHGISF